MPNKFHSHEKFLKFFLFLIFCLYIGNFQIKTKKNMKFKFLILSSFSILFFKKIEKQTFRKRRKTKKCSAITIIVKITCPHTSVFCFFIFYFFVILFFVFAKFKPCFLFFCFPRRYNT